ncbi:sensor histidine kinase [Streptomyces marincola]|uniref:histidine kinase n=1 Tax=Streptomyces marincola TaxID=2878388 RepID=A0A1W7CWR6_9ACTN|nr:sensor histidine kinase [Streptomyces marincola]ARQ69238.1 histidine kinase [Streptomyces marincola]
MTSPSAPPGPRDGGTLPPPRSPLARQTWRECAYLVSSWPADLIASLYVTSWIFAGVLTSVTVVGLPVLALGLAGCRRLGAWERARARALLRVAVEEPSALRAGRDSGFFPWLWTALRDPVGWRSALFFVVRLPWTTLTCWLTIMAYFVAWPLLPWLARWATNVDRALVRSLLGPSDELERRIAELESDRSVVVDASAADLRRIERDLHDGAQARLVALAMDLGLAKEKLTHDPQAAARMVDEAHGEVKLALQELRDLARGIHPAILTDRGLGPALSAIASRCTVPVTVTVDLPHRPAPAIEGIAYYTASELLQNISKHSNAHHATIDAWHTGNHLMLHITDDGHGGANPTNGTGLAGLAERLTAVDGLLTITSPTGGPTTITAQLPWRDRTPAPGGPDRHGGRTGHDEKGTVR